MILLLHLDCLPSFIVRRRQFFDIPDHVMKLFTRFSHTNFLPRHLRQADTVARHQPGCNNWPSQRQIEKATYLTGFLVGKPNDKAMIPVFESQNLADELPTTGNLVQHLKVTRMLHVQHFGNGFQRLSETPIVDPFQKSKTVAEITAGVADAGTVHCEVFEEPKTVFSDCVVFCGASWRWGDC